MSIISLSDVEALTALAKRLEAAALRLEELAQSNHFPPGMVEAVQRDFWVAPSQERLPTYYELETPDIVTDFDDFISEALQPYVDASTQLGGSISTQSHFLHAAFQLQRNYLILASRARKPGDQSAIEELLQPVRRAADRIVEIADNIPRDHEAYNHVHAVSSSLFVLGWTTAVAKPHLFVEKQIEPALYWCNRVRVEWKEKDERHIEWVKTYCHIFEALAKFCKKNLIWGVEWNPDGGDALDVLREMKESGQWR